MFGIKQYISSISKESKEIDAIDKEEESPDDEGLIHLDIRAKIPFTTSSGLKSIKTYEQTQEQYTGCLAVFWVGFVVGLAVTLLIAVSVYVGWIVLKKHVSRHRALDLDDMSENPFVRNYKTNKQVMDKSNNFTIDSDTFSSSEEELFCLSEHTPIISPLKSTTKLTLTSTPIKAKENVTRSLPTTPTKGIIRPEVKLPISPLALEKVTSK